MAPLAARFPVRRLVLGSRAKTCGDRTCRSNAEEGYGEEKDRGRLHRRGRRLCRRAYGQGRRRRDLYRFLARACRAHEKARADDHPFCEDVEPFTVPVRALHVTEAQQLSKEKPFDIAFVCTKCYDTAWATTMIKQYLAPDGYCRLAAELHERGDDRRRRRLGQDAGLDRQLDHRRPQRAGPDRPRRRQVGHEAHRVPRRRGAWPRHRPRQGSLRRCSPTPTARWSPRICGASAGRSSSPT